MPFLPGGDRCEALASLTQALRLAPAFLRIYPTVVLRDTPLPRLAANGLYRPATLRAAVDCSAEMLWRCQRHGTPVIRLGLQGTSELKAEGAIVAGPYHPAFGQLVRSRLWFRAFLARQRGHGVAFRVAPFDLADARGHRRGNLVQLLRRWPRTSIDPDPELARGRFRAASETFTLTTLNLYQE
jgi:histone acetyltransferase (RNA polymerase elongator complex component)